MPGFTLVLFLVLINTIVLLSDSSQDCGNNIFLSNSNVECVSFPSTHLGAQYFKIIVNTLKDYSLISLPFESLVINLPIRPLLQPDTLLNQNQIPITPNSLIGVALDGVPIYSALLSEDLDILRNDDSLKVDSCGGSYGPTADGVRYHYRAMPSCILNNLNEINRRKSHVKEIEELLDYFQSYHGHYILGFALSGYPIYSPFDSRGHLHEDLDSCNGKYVNGSYGYYATPIFPYIMSCQGPGTYDYAAQSSTAETLPLKVGISYNACPAGYVSSSRRSGCTPCPAGTYASASSCGPLCPLGHYCPLAAVRPTKCPAGTYGSALGLTSALCSGVCRAGYFCPQASTQPDRYPCGSTSFYCPAGSSERIRVSPTFYTLPEDDRHPYRRFAQSPCIPGHYCANGIKYPCPPGTFGSTADLMFANCTALCPMGFYCPETSVHPIPCPAGTYGSVLGLSTAACSGLCHPGHWCPLASISPTQRVCVSGRIGEGPGLSTSECNANCDGNAHISQFVSDTIDDSSSNTTDVSSPSPSSTERNGKLCVPQPCTPGFYCTQGSTMANRHVCGSPAFYCSVGSSLPTPVSDGYYTIGPFSLPSMPQVAEDNFTRWDQRICEPGYWCLHGVRTACRGGMYGSEYGLHSPQCSGMCMPGYYCPLASTRYDQIACGSPSVYCPMGSALPTAVPMGYYTINGTLSSRHDIAICTAGSYCMQGMKFICKAGIYGGHSGLSTPDCEGICKEGYYCPAGSTSKKQFPCPAGRYSTAGAIDANCTGLCYEGYYCPVASTSPKQQRCGGETLYCPRGSGAPRVVNVGNFSTGGTALTRVGESSSSEHLSVNYSLGEKGLPGTMAKLGVFRIILCVSHRHDVSGRKRSHAHMCELELCTYNTSSSFSTIISPAYHKYVCMALLSSTSEVISWPSAVVSPIIAEDSIFYTGCIMSLSGSSP
eukprot:gene9845-20480_t